MGDMEPDFRGGVAVFGNMPGVPVESPQDQLTASPAGARPWCSPWTRDVALLRMITASYDEDSQFRHGVSCPRALLRSCPRALHDRKRTGWRSGRFRCSAWVRSNIPQGKISNRNFGNVNQSAFQ